MENKKNLFEWAMKAEWNKVVEQYNKDETIYGAKITKSDDTALHIAASDGQEDVVTEIVGIMCRDPEKKKLAVEALLVRNKRGDTPLHIAASQGSVNMCHCIAEVDYALVSARNHDKETPFFLTVLHGKEEAFHCLYKIVTRVHHEDTLDILRGNGGDTILHAAISGEYFNMAFQIIHLYDQRSPSNQAHELVNARNERGVTPLHILASKPTAFRSGNHLKGYSRVIYHCTFVDGLKEDDGLKEETVSSENVSCKHATKKSDESNFIDAQCPKNYHTVVYFLSLVWRMIEVVMWPSKRSRGDTENPQGQRLGSEQLLPPSYNTCFELIKFASKAVLVIVGSGSSKVRKIREKKEQHAWSAQLMNELLERVVMYEYEESGGCPSSEESIMLDFTEHDQQKQHEVSDKGKIENPILIAAKNGVTEMVEKILEKYPVAIHDMNVEGKNLVLLAVEHRQPHVYRFLLDQNTEDTKSNGAKDSVFRHVDNDGNSALHLAAKLGDYKPWLIPGAALQMQWELKWYEFVKNSMSRHFFVRHNKEGKTPKDIFSATHQELLKSGGEWLTHTSESCSVVAALIATVAFATSATVPGGVKQESGTPTLEHHPAFNAFAISSLIALCFSVTSVIMFLAILTSRYQETDFRRDLPGKLLVGLSSLFVSIAAILVSFCAGHFFVLKDKLRYAAFPVYTMVCLPVTLFAIAQFPLYFDLIWATWKHVPQRSYMVVPA
ncbi:hypothetical protein K2173_018394 [Erythroxylum novogranatense]|uniref:PGG domain-containing protein n=1 Tax=Erythroxylum novogranatense TaxID=1862640 RepID=A0AAV8UAG5_9ROSI|nr:hypothetical protein K2173_018394 [Erythroxylum novogranatense]